MGYSTDFEGRLTIEPPLNPTERNYINQFCDTRRMDRERGPYWRGTGFAGQDHEADIRDYNSPPEGQPGLWCKLEVSEDGSELYWNGAEKTYDLDEWVAYIIDHFLKRNAKAEAYLKRVSETSLEHLGPHEVTLFETFNVFTFDHTVDGVMKAQGEDPDDHWAIVVKDNAVAKTIAPGDGVMGVTLRSG